MGNSNISLNDIITNKAQNRLPNRIIIAFKFNKIISHYHVTEKRPPLVSR